MPDSATTEPTNVAEMIAHPIRLRIIQQLSGRELTTAELRESLPEVKQATLYRHITALLGAGLVAVVAERKVRGAVERTLALGETMAHVDREGLNMLSEAQLSSAFLTFLGGVAEDFDRAVAAQDASARDFLGFGRGPIHVDAEDLARIQEGFSELLAPYLEDRGDGKRRVSLATILLPES